MKLSVIIPVYKAEQTLNHCVESVLAQKGVDMQVVLVDDGSPDRCPQLCDEWAARDGRIEVVHKQNGGLSDARNAGLEVAEGELITFVDSDDFIARDTYSEVIGQMRPDTDIIEYPIHCHYGAERQSLLKFEPKVYTSNNDYWFRGKAYTHSYMCNKIFRRTVFDGVRFPVGRVFEDAATLPLLLGGARKVQTTHSGLYLYCDNNTGITATARGEDLRQLLMAHLDHWDVMASDDYYLHVLNIQIDVWRLTGKDIVLKSKKVWRWRGLTMRQRLKAMALNVLGVKGLCRLYRLCS